MATSSAPARPPSTARTARRLLLIWQNPTTRQLLRVGQLDQLADGHFAFQYLPGAHEPQFAPLVQFPDLDRLYESPVLPAFFANRVMARTRPSYQEFRLWLGLEQAGADTPFEVLLRTGGPRATDTFHVVDDLAQSADGRVVSRFLASGIRHVWGANDRLRLLRGGERLCLRDEPDNCANPRAILIDVRNREPLGYVPDWLVEDVHALRERSLEFTVTAERVSPEAPWHLQLLCRIEAAVSVR